jgi:hypothetical protein
MSVWTELVGTRRDLRLRGKWWHHVAVGLGVFSAFLVYLIVDGRVANRPLKLTAANTYSLTLLHDAKGRQTTTTLADLDALTGMVGSVNDKGDLVKLPRSSDADIRCENQARYKAGQSIKVGERSYRAILDYSGQPPGEGRHCVATPEYAAVDSLTATSIAVFVPDGTGLRKQQVQGFFSGISAMMVWLLLYWNVYYRGLMPIYARRRQLRRRRHFERQGVR